MKKRVILFATLLASLFTGGTSPAATLNPMCGTQTAPHVTHVIVIAEENHGYSQVIGPAPTITSMANQCALLTQAYGIQFPSLPNYIGATNGSIPTYIATGGKNGGKDCLPGGSCVVPGSGIFGQVSSWREYAESATTNCQKTNNSAGYVTKHTPPVYYTGLATACKQYDVPLGTTTSGRFESDLASGTIGAFNFVTPNENNDMHDGTVAQGDAWLAKWLPLIFASPAYKDGSTAVILWMDSGAKVDNHIPIVVISPSTPSGLKLATKTNHYGVLHTVESTLGVACLGKACTAPDLHAQLGL